MKKAFEKVYSKKLIDRDIKMAGRTDEAILNDILNKNVACDEKKDELKKAYFEILKKEIKRHRYKVADGVKEFILESLKNDVQCIVVTGNWADAAVIKLEPSGLLKYFKKIFGCTSETDRFHILKKAFESMNGEKNRFYVFGDTELDILAAKRLGVRSVLINTAFKSNPDFHFTSFTQALDKLRNLL